VRRGNQPVLHNHTQSWSIVRLENEAAEHLREFEISSADGVCDVFRRTVSTRYEDGFG
jgi:hypothetical protein